MSDTRDSIPDDPEVDIIAYNLKHIGPGAIVEYVSSGNRFKSTYLSIGSHYEVRRRQNDANGRMSFLMYDDTGKLRHAAIPSVRLVQKGLSPIGEAEPSTEHVAEFPWDQRAAGTHFPNDALPQSPGRNDYISDELMNRIQARISV